MRARAAFRWWRWVLTCLLLTFVAPSPAAAQLEDGITWQAEPAPASPSSPSLPSLPSLADSASRAVAGAPERAVEIAAAKAGVAAPAQRIDPLYLLNCALLR